MRSTDHCPASTTYHKTAEAWLAKVNGRDQARLWHQRWWIFFMAFSQVWHHAGGKAWLVSYYRMRKLNV